MKVELSSTSFFAYESGLPLLAQERTSLLCYSAVSPRGNLLLPVKKEVRQGHGVSRSFPECVQRYPHENLYAVRFVEFQKEYV
ncbi:hypothetical protein QYM36_014767 [Artemia franciscana]|uniref:Uncharacterized protein n=1 Tax=Artemia franciscana TaxID=6661 RepID=A0AA88HGX3_ARTSF|nr:hypothetical protein QYM36_014767 [Artemia franciscana]